MSIHPQFTYDNQGNPLGVFLSMEDWRALSEEVHFDIPQWQQDLTLKRLAEYRANPTDVMDADEFFEALRKEEHEGL